MKTRIGNMIIGTLAGCLFLLALSALVLSLIPVSGQTLPEWIGIWTGWGFSGAALLISILVGVLAVLSFLLSALFQSRAVSEV